MQELISINKINESYLNYLDERSCKRWIEKRGISIVRLGKKLFIRKDEFEKMIDALLKQEAEITYKENRAPDKPRITKQSEVEKSIYKELLDKL